MQATTAAAQEAGVHRLRELRLDKAWTQRELANRADVTKETVSRLEKSRNVPQPTTLGKLARALGVEPKELRHQHAATER